jgi:hypothetical protein
MEQKTARAISRRLVMKKHHDLVAVRPLRHRGKMIEAGTDLDRSEFQQFHLQSLYRRRRIGVKGDAWTNLYLEQWAKKGGTVVNAPVLAAEEEGEVDEPISLLSSLGFGS